MNRLDPFYIAAALVASPFLLSKQRRGWSERMGHVGKMLRATPGDAEPGDRKPRAVVHAVSVGEVNALRTLVPILASDCEVIVSTTTDTGLARAKALFAGEHDVVRYPLDFSWSVRRFLDAVRPDAVALAELEVWPNFVAECARRGIPVSVINGRLSERSFKGYRRLRWFFRPTFASLRCAAVQDADYARRFEAMGIPADRVAITGSMKWDNAHAGEPDERTRALAAELAENMGIDRRKPLVVAGSTGPGEESLIHRACAEAGVQLLCAPRKPERFDEAALAVRGCVRRSRTRLEGPPKAAADRFLLDTIGELAAAYWLADIAIVGRSFGDLHGSDPIEPIGMGRPTIIGPAVGDFRSIVSQLEGAGGIVRADRDSLATTIRGLLETPGNALALAERGVACIHQQRGASARHAQIIRDTLSNKPGEPWPATP